MENTTVTAELATPRYPVISDRVQSTFIDTVVVVILMFGVASLLDKFSSPPDWIRIVLFFALFGVYEPVCVAFGCTIGNYLKGIRVRDADDQSKRINILAAFLRYILKVLLGWISFLSVQLNPERRAIHDLAAGSVMIRV
ncbi:MAG: RDD family protein [Pedobacter sp.]|nr:MAG: RDD family protein [Pedobacter sp.]